MSQPPIIPGPDPYEQQPQYPPPPPQPIPVYQVGASRSDIVGKSMIGTVVVVLTLFLLICALPVALCVGCGTMASITNGGT